MHRGKYPPKHMHKSQCFKRTIDVRIVVVHHIMDLYYRSTVMFHIPPFILLSFMPSRSLQSWYIDHNWSLWFLITSSEKKNACHVFLWKIPATSCLSLSAPATCISILYYFVISTYTCLYINIINIYVAWWYAPVLSQLHHLLGGLSTWDANGLSRTEPSNWK